LDEAVTQTPHYTSGPYLYFKITGFDFTAGFITGDFYFSLHHTCCWIMKKEAPIIILVLLSALLFCIHQYLQLQAQFNIEFLDNYLDPAVLMPLLLYALLWERRILLRNKTLDLPNAHILGYFLLIILVGELLFPILSEKFTADYWDILAYASGTLAYVFARKVSRVINFRNLSNRNLNLN